MTPHTIDQAAVPGIRRPMSLLLQALKQIESKAPGETVFVSSSADDDVSCCETHRASAAEPPTPCVPEVASEIGSSALIAAAPFMSETTAAPNEVSIEVIRQYDEAETDSQVALADSFELPVVPLSVAPESPASATFAPRHNAYRLGEEVYGLLPDDARAVIAIVSFDGTTAEPVAHDICGGLAGLKKGAVLEIDVDGAAASEGSKITLVEVASGHGRWQEAVVRHPHLPFSSLPRGDLRALKAISRRRLLRIWQELGEHFEYVVVEVASADLDQALPILATCDGAFIALRLNETKRADVDQLAARIRASGCHLCGCLVR